jgi:hypothetical protein
MNVYYVYVIYCQEKYLESTVVYVGKGKDGRLRNHLYMLINHETPKRLNKHLFNKCKKILKNGGSVFGEKIGEGLTEGDALSLEASKIEEIGIDNLCNISPFGCMNTPPRGTDTHREYIQKISEASKRRWSDPNYKEKMVKIRQGQGRRQRGANHPMFGTSMPDSTKQKLKEANTNRTYKEETREKMRKAMTGREIKWKDKISKSNKRVWREKIKDGYTISEEVRQKISTSSLGNNDKFLDQEIIAKICEMYKNMGPNRIHKKLLEDGLDISPFLIRRTLKEMGIYIKYAKNPTRKIKSSKIDKYIHQKNGKLLVRMSKGGVELKSVVSSWDEAFTTRNSFYKKLNGEND